MIIWYRHLGILGLEAFGIDTSRPFTINGRTFHFDGDEQIRLGSGQYYRTFIEKLEGLTGADTVDTEGTVDYAKFLEEKINEPVTLPTQRR